MLPPNVKTSPSSSGRWMGCTKSPRYVAENPDEEPAPHANTTRGVEEHDESAQLLTGKRKRTRNPHVRAYVQYARSLPGTVLGVEMEVPVFYRPEKPCYIDYATLEDSDGVLTLHILDLKSGTKFVSAWENSQCAIYMESFLRDWLLLLPRLPDRVKAHIFMPRQPEDKQIQTWDVSLQELREGLVAEIQAKHDLIVEGTQTEFLASEKTCIDGWCPRRYNCEAREQLATSPFRDLGPSEASDEFIGRCVANEKAMIKIIKDFAKEGARRAYNDHSFLERARLKFVAGRQGNRKYKEDAPIVEVLGKKALEPPTPPKPLSPTQVEEQLGKDEYAKIEKYVERSPAKPLLVGIDDKRKALPSPAEESCSFEVESEPGEVFEVETEETEIDPLS